MNDLLSLPHWSPISPFPAASHTSLSLRLVAEPLLCPLPIGQMQAFRLLHIQRCSCRPYRSTYRAVFPSLLQHQGVNECEYTLQYVPG